MNSSQSAQKLKKYQYKLINLIETEQAQQTHNFKQTQYLKQLNHLQENQRKTYMQKINYYSNELVGGFFENPVYDRVLTNINVFMSAFILPNVLTDEERKDPTTLFLTSDKLNDPKYQKEILKSENLSRFRDLLLNPTKIVKPEDKFTACDNVKWDFYVWLSKDGLTKNTTELIILDLLGLKKDQNLTKISLEKKVGPFDDAHITNIFNKFGQTISTKYDLYKFNDCLTGYIVRQIICAIRINNVYASLPKVTFNFDLGNFFGQVTGGIPGIAMAAITFDYKGAGGVLANNSKLVSESLKLNDVNQSDIEYIYKKDRKDCGWCRFMDNLYNSN